MKRMMHYTFELSMQRVDVIVPAKEDEEHEELVAQQEAWKKLLERISINSIDEDDLIFVCKEEAPKEVEDD